jgi:hypothetical protein
MSFPGLDKGRFSLLSCLVVVSSIPLHSFAQNTNCAPVPAGIASWWRGEGNANDSTGTNNGTLVNNPGFTPAKAGQGLWFSDYGQLVSVPDSPSLDSTNQLTLECWFFQTSLGQLGQWVVTPIVEKGDAASLGFGSPSSNLQFYIGLTNTTGAGYDPDHWFFQVGVRLSSGLAIVTGSTAVHIALWHHVAMTYDGANLKLYVNGNQEGDVGATGSIVPSSASLDIGGHGVPFAVPCIVDELSLYNRALSSNEVQAIVQSGSAGKCSGATPPPPTPPCVAPPAGMVSWWQAETNAFDSIGTNDGTVRGVSYVPGKVGNAFYFPNSPFLSFLVPDAPSLDLTNSISIEAWVYPTAVVAGFGPIVAKGNYTESTIAYRFIMRSSSAQSYLAASIGTPSLGYVSGATVVQTNTWSHVAMTYDGAALNLYVNGELDATIAASGHINSIPDPVFLGTEGSRYFIGLLDEVAIYNRALSATEIKAIYDAGSAGKCNNVLSVSAPPGNLSVAWPLSAKNFQLESTFGDLVGTNSWNPAIANLLTNGGRIQLVVPMSRTKGFFRLRQQ